MANYEINAGEGRDHWLARAYVPLDLRGELEKADVLLLPQEGFREFDGPLYPVGTEELLSALKEGASDAFSVDVTVSEDDYKELALHSEWVILASVFVGTSVVVPTVVSLISEYLKRRIWKNEGQGLKMRLLVEQREEGRTQCLEVFYEGPAHDFENSMASALDSLRDRGLRVPAGGELGSGREPGSVREVPGLPESEEEGRDG